jgi:glycosyltransferase involved in cell wall biosynthesis
LGTAYRRVVAAMTSAPSPYLVVPEAACSAALSLKSAGRWVNVLSHLDAKYGGLSSIVPQLCVSVAEAGLATTSVAAFCLPGEHAQTSCVPPRSITYWPTSRIEWIRSPQLRARFERTLAEADGVHIHGLWEQSSNVAARTARALGKPYMISAHGMLEPWALANKRFKKRLYSALIERANLDGAACLHALTRAEAEDYRRFGCTGPIAVIPNAVHIPRTLDPSLFHEAYPSLRGRRLILFLGRIHFKKGLDLLVDSWAQLARAWPDAHLVLAGPDSEGTRAGIEQRIAQAGLVDAVTFTGMLDSRMKWSAYAAAACFVLPSYSEGLSTSVLEAIAAGLPIILTEQSHMPEVAEHHAGWVIQPEVDDLTGALSAALSAAPATSRATGARGRRLIEQQYSWPSVAARMGEIYRWVATGERPTCVDLLNSLEVKRS